MAENTLNTQPGGLESLATLIQGISQPQQQPSPFIQGPQGPILDARTQNPMNNVMSGLQGLASNYIAMQKMQRKKVFMDSVSTIMGGTGTTDDKLNKLLELKVKHGGDDYGLGLDKIAESYEKIATGVSKTAVKKWEPTTKEEALEVARAKNKGKLIPGTYADKISQKEIANVTLSRASDELVAKKNSFAQFMGPGKAALRHPMRSYVNADLRDFLAWKAIVKDAFQQYRVAITGAQASDKEIALLEKNRPTDEDTYEVFLMKSQKVQEMGDIVLNRYIKNLGRAGYDITGFEDMIGKTAETQVGTEMPQPLPPQNKVGKYTLIQ